MNPEREKIFTELIEEYKWLWEKVDFIKDEHAKARAINGLRMEKSLNPVANGTSQKRSGGGGKKYDKCPRCGNTEINFTSFKNNKAFQKCLKCQIYLNADGSTPPIPQQQGT